MNGQKRGQMRVRVQSVTAGESIARIDTVVTEEPLEMRIRSNRIERRVAITMRTPGNDYELAAGFLFAEGIINQREEIVTIRYCTDRQLTPEERSNVVTVSLRSLGPVERIFSERTFGVSSACGVCGKEQLDDLERRGINVVADGPTVSPATICALPDALRQAQGLFSTTGGLHAAGLFDRTGALVALREDVGRHNALDKLIGWALLEGKLPLHDSIILVSGRTSFELAQKSAAAGVPMLCSVSAPSSFAVDLARRFGMTLIGFLRGDHFNIYTGERRIET